MPEPKPYTTRHRAGKGAVDLFLLAMPSTNWQGLYLSKEDVQRNMASLSLFAGSEVHCYRVSLAMDLTGEAPALSATFEREL